MKLSELIAELQKLEPQFGELPVSVSSPGGLRIVSRLEIDFRISPIPTELPDLQYAVVPRRDTPTIVLS